MAYLNGNKVFLYGERTVDANLTTKTIKQNGTYNASADNADGYSSVTVDVTNSQGEYYCVAVDPDGTVIKEAWLNNGDTFTLPEPLVHSGLVFEEWSATQQLTETTVNGVTTYSIIVSDNHFIAGALYHTSSDLSEFDITIDIISGLTIELNCMSGSTIDWGDGTSETATTTGYISHTYSSYGNYTIKTNSDYENITTPILNQSSYNSPASKNSGLLKSIRCSKTVNLSLNGTLLVNNFNLQSIYFSKNITRVSPINNSNQLKALVLPKQIYDNKIQTNHFAYCRNLKYLVIPYGVTTISSDATNSCWNMLIILPKTITSIGSNAFSLKYTPLKSLIIPGSITFSSTGQFIQCRYQKVKILSGVTSIPNDFLTNGKTGELELPNTVTTIGSNAFPQVYNKIFVIPDSVTSIGNSAFNSCISDEIIVSNQITSVSSSCFINGFFNKITFRGNIATINASAFSGCYSCLIYDFTHCASVPTLANTSAFSNTVVNSKILVPSSLYNSWVAASNWVTYASRIVPVDLT